ncbi:LLM class flavin-dependent oxidoreductase [Pseudofrankia inefficax]|uniref:Luciferase-like, subgroup n=1 Tax=Pseudofrankia inefficax (strain DSM 45817 / CECT 9037 / DDB 130130 / EuI1c) TaxID=298654 RepID=E3J7T9_PSEI1|nr:LLM class flavin-dependent oxidoreductase [Pseudofrankia inefficax]ADP80843.1 Luciferase-like, subgroup [Pseudofrankia inefficax]
MRLGLYVDMRNPPRWERSWDRHYGRWLERLEEAERLGAPSVWLTEHHFFDDGYLPQCWIYAAAIAARTSRLRIGSAVSLLPLHSPLEFAEQIALADVISGGRIEPGFGVGYRKPEYVAFGGDFKRRYLEFEDRIGALRALWGEVPGAERTVTPAPIQRPVPMWGGFGGPRGAGLAGRLGLGLQSLDRALLEPYLAGLRAGGHDESSARMGHTVQFFLSDDPEKAWSRISDHVSYRWLSYNRYMYEGTRREAAPPAYFDPDSIRDEVLIGTPDQVAAAIRARVAGLPVTDVFFWADFPGLPDELIDRHIELSLTELAPRLAADDGSSA